MRITVRLLGQERERTLSEMTELLEVAMPLSRGKIAGLVIMI